MPFRRRILLSWISTLLFLFPFCAIASNAPATPAGTTSETYFDIQVADPYRWLEDMKSIAFQAWTHEQSEYADKMLARISGRNKLKARIAELKNTSESIRAAKPVAGKLFYLKLESGHNAYRLYVRDGDGNDRLLLDPETLSLLNGRQAIDFFSPSPDGKLVAVGVSPGGSEDSTLHVIDAESGAWLADEIDGAGLNEEGVGWHDGSRAFFYNRLRPADKSGRRERYGKSVVRDHIIGQPPEQDKAVLGYGVTVKRHFAIPDLPIVKTSPDSKYALAIIKHGSAVDRSLYIAPLSAVNGADTPWRKIAGPQNRVRDAYLHGDQLYLLSHQGAPRYQLLRMNVAQPDVARARIVVAAGSAVLREAVVANDALYLRQTDDGAGQLMRVPYDDKPTAFITLPFNGSIRELAADPQSGGAIVEMESWTESPRYLRVNPGSSTVSDSGLVKPSPVRFSGMETQRVLVKGADGVAVPLSLIYKKGIKLDGSNPTILYGYGAYGTSIDADFSPIRLAWLERGGVYAVAHVRGGGEFGEDWHSGAHILNKANSIRDFITCAQYLVREGYTSPKRLAASGDGAGGITVGGAITRRPDLFAAAHDAVGISDMLRMELTLDGASNIAEFGTVRRKGQFIAMLALSPYHQVREGLAYPAVIFTTGVNDPHVETWQPAKFAARLQAASSSGKPVILRIDYDAGHGIGSTKAQMIAETADVWSFFLWQMDVPGFEVNP